MMFRSILKNNFISGRWQSILYACQGIRTFFGSEKNAVVHLFFTALVLLFAILFPLTRMEAILLILVISLVWILEMMNTAIEKLADFSSPSIHPLIKQVKDIAAGAVLVACLAAILCGLLIFIPKIIQS